MLEYYQKERPITLSADASQLGVGAVIIQAGHPLTCTFCSLTETRQKYAQIEKKTLAIVHGNKKFHHYVFGQPKVTVESDHKPLKLYLKKPPCQCPLRLQRMRLNLQKYKIIFKYKPGEDLLQEDALSRFPNVTHLKEETEEFEVNVIDCLPILEKRLYYVLQETN